MTFLPQWEACIRAGTYNIMCSYSRYHIIIVIIIITLLLTLGIFTPEGIKKIKNNKNKKIKK